MSAILTNSWSALIGASNDSLQRETGGPLPSVSPAVAALAPGGELVSQSGGSRGANSSRTLGQAAGGADDDRSSSSSSPEPAEVQSLQGLIQRKHANNMNYSGFAGDQMQGIPGGMNPGAYPGGPFVKSDASGMLMMPNGALVHAGGFSTQMGAAQDVGASELSEREEKREKHEKPEKEKSKSKKKSKKRGRGDASDASDVSRVRLSREDLLRVSSKELEDFAARCAAERPLSPEEVREIKRQRRLIKNREYAQASRVKKKDHLKEIESRFTDLEEENYNLKLQLQNMQSRMHLVEAENRELKSKLANSANVPSHVPVQLPSAQVAMSNGSVPSALPQSSVAIGASGLGLGLPPLTSSLGELKFSGGAIGASGFIGDLFSSDGATAPMPAFRPMNSGGSM